MPDKIVNHFVLADGSVARYDAGSLVNTGELLNEVTNMHLTNLFSGEYIHLVPNNGILVKDNAGQSTYAEIKNGLRYEIKASGNINRFLVLGTNSISEGSQVTRLNTNQSRPSAGDSCYFEFTNTNYKYVVVTLAYSVSNFSANVEILENTVDEDDTFLVNGVDVYTKAQSYNLFGIPSAYSLSIWDGVYHPVFTTNTVVVVDQNVSSAIVDIQNSESVKIVASGAFNRFVIGVCNSYVYGSSATIVFSVPNSNVGNYHEYTYENTDGYKFLVVSVAYSLPNFPNNFNLFITDEKGDKENYSISGVELYTKKQLKTVMYNQYVSGSNIQLVSTTSELYSLYDELVSNSQGYVTKNVLGQNSQGTDICEYVFTSGNYNAKSGERYPDSIVEKPVVLIVTGVHGYEKTSIMSTYQFFYDLCTGNTRLYDIRENYTFKVIPVVTPYSFDNNSRINENGVNINRNFPVGWVQTQAGDDYSGASPADQLETQIVMDWIDDNTDAILYVDFHNSAYVNEVSCLLGNNDKSGMPELKSTFLKSISSVSPYWIFEKSFSISLNFAYTGNLDTGGTSQKYAESKGLLSSTMECSWNQNSTGVHSPTSIATGAEVLGNFIDGVYDS